VGQEGSKEKGIDGDSWNHMRHSCDDRLEGDAPCSFLFRLRHGTSDFNMIHLDRVHATDPRVDTRYGSCICMGIIKSKGLAWGGGKVVAESQTTSRPRGN